LNAPWAGTNSLTIISGLVDDIVTVSDAEIARAMAVILERTKLLVEPAGAAGVAALLAGRVRHEAGQRTVTILSGGNVDLARLHDILALGGLSGARERSN
jgi:threonine dehydratase